MLSTLISSASRSASLAVLARHAKSTQTRGFISSSDMKCPKTHKIKSFDTSEWPNSGPHSNKKLIPVEQYYPKVLETTKDLDGMDLTIQAAPKALHYGHVGEYAGQVAEDYQGCIRQPHPIWTAQECNDIQITHLAPKGFGPRLAWCIVWCLRRVFDVGTGYSLGIKTDKTMLIRITILETVAGIPGMVGGAIRHFKSLRKTRQDFGWIHSLLEEAENERMHLMIALQMYNPGIVTRALIHFGQLLVLPFYAMAYGISPKFCHTFVGYLEEEAVKTYTQMLDLMDKGKLPKWDCTAPEAARKYYHLPEGASMRDVVTNIRADEAHHRELNHCLAWMKPNDVNPFGPGY